MIRATVTCTIDDLRQLTDSTFVLRFERQGIDFEPGQYLSVGAGGDIHMREYSIYSAQDRDFLEILVKAVPEGHVTRRLAECRPGDTLTVEGPFGFFTIDEGWREHRHVFVGTGTGISPFHCFVGSCPELDYTLLHGIRHGAERYEHDAYDRDRLVTCTSRDGSGDYRGRVTDWFRDHRDRIDPAARYYLCGNCDMIYEAFDILQDADVPHNQLFAEVYF
ncbi:MAG: oxidoreductase [Spirochaetaceae bacterium]|nr:MAG: oxidoreductase [Spirochaetaceae bacterium]